MAIRFGDRVAFRGHIVGLVVGFDDGGIAIVADAAGEARFLISDLRPAPREDGSPCLAVSDPSRPGPAGACVGLERAA